jgi:hypothetical protein
MPAKSHGDCFLKKNTFIIESEMKKAYINYKKYYEEEGYKTFGLGFR